jgi:hypothetical protein
MSPPEELFALYKQWRRLTQSEGDAIRVAAWPQVEQCQQAKARLQPRIGEISRQIDAHSHDQHFRPVVRELIQLEQRNRELLQAQREVARHQKEQLDQSSRHLRQIHRHYVAAAPVHWQSYS